MKSSVLVKCRCKGHSFRIPKSHVVQCPACLLQYSPMDLISCLDNNSAAKFLDKAGVAKSSNYTLTGSVHTTSDISTISPKLSSTTITTTYLDGRYGSLHAERNLYDTLTHNVPIILKSLSPYFVLKILSMENADLSHICLNLISNIFMGISEGNTKRIDASYYFLANHKVTLTLEL